MSFTQLQQIFSQYPFKQDEQSGQPNITSYMATLPGDKAPFESFYINVQVQNNAVVMRSINGADHRQA